MRLRLRLRADALTVHLGKGQLATVDAKSLVVHRH